MQGSPFIRINDTTIFFKNIASVQRCFEESCVTVLVKGSETPFIFTEETPERAVGLFSSILAVLQKQQDTSFFHFGDIIVPFADVSAITKTNCMIVMQLTSFGNTVHREYMSFGSAEEATKIFNALVGANQADTNQNTAPASPPAPEGSSAVGPEKASERRKNKKRG